MMRRTWMWIVLDLLALVVCFAAVVPSWRAGIESTAFAASADQPAFEATHYSGPWLGLAALLVAVAGLAVIDLVARVARPTFGNRW